MTCPRCNNTGKFILETAGGDEVLMDCKCPGMKPWTLHLITFYRRPGNGWYLGLFQKDRQLPDQSWCLLALVWMPKYHRLKFFFNTNA